MKPTTYLFFLFLLTCSYACQETSTSSYSNPPSEWQSVFNGKNLGGWYSTGKMKTTIEEGILKIHATQPNNNAWIFTKKSYRNFKLELEFLMSDTTANSGVLFRYDPAKDGKPNQIAYEANIDWRSNRQNVMGTIENAARATLLKNSKPNEWNTLRIEANGDYLQVFLNDQRVSATHNRRSTQGHIGLQVPISQGDDIAFRAIKVQSLPDTPTLEIPLEDQYRNSTQPMATQFTNGYLEGWHTVGNSTWTIDGGVLHAYSGAKPGFLVTDKSYKNFYLKCSFKIAKEDNSGIFIRKHPESSSINSQDAIECNIYDHQDYTHVFSTGSIVNHARSWWQLIDYDNWNEMEIFAKEEHIILYINGKKSAEAHLPASFNKAGNICLQAGTRIFSDNGPSNVYFKEVGIRVMD